MQSFSGLDAWHMADIGFSDSIPERRLFRPLDHVLKAGQRIWVLVNPVEKLCIIRGDNCQHLVRWHRLALNLQDLVGIGQRGCDCSDGITVAQDVDETLCFLNAETEVLHRACRQTFVAYGEFPGTCDDLIGPNFISLVVIDRATTFDGVGLEICVLDFTDNG